MAANGNGAPVIIKRKKVVAGGGHHGGAWKVAYADFVTAMMAFFMLMWLLNATTEKQRKGLADYFSPTIAISRSSSGGDADLRGSSVFAEDTLPQDGTGATAARPAERDAANGAQAPAEDAAARAAETRVLEQTRAVLLEKLVEAEDGNSLLQHVGMDIDDTGLVIELFDLPGAPLFVADGSESPQLRQIAALLAELAGLVVNPVAIEAHTAAYPVVMATDPSWDVSGARAARMRGLMTGAGLAPDRVQRTVSHADRRPAHDNPMSTRNNRIEVVFLR